MFARQSHTTVTLQCRWYKPVCSALPSATHFSSTLDCSIKTYLIFIHIEHLQTFFTCSRLVSYKRFIDHFASSFPGETETTKNRSTFGIFRTFGPSVKIGNKQNPTDLSNCISEKKPSTLRLGPSACISLQLDKLDKQLSSIFPFSKKNCFIFKKGKNWWNVTEPLFTVISAVKACKWVTYNWEVINCRVWTQATGISNTLPTTRTTIH